MQNVHGGHFIGCPVDNELYDVRFIFHIFGCADQHIGRINGIFLRRQLVDADSVFQDLSRFQGHGRIDGEPAVKAVPQPLCTQDHIRIHIIHTDNGISVFVGAAYLLSRCNGSGDNVFSRLAAGDVICGVVHHRYLHIRLGRQCLIGVVSLLVLHLIGRFFLTTLCGLAYTINGSVPPRVIAFFGIRALNFGERFFFHMPHIVDNTSTRSFSDRYGRFVIFPIEVHEVRRSIIPSIARHISMAGIFVCYRFFAFGGYLHQFINMRCSVCLSLKCCVTHGSPITGVVVAQLSRRGSCEQEDIPVLRNELDILPVPDFAVDVVLQLFTPALRITAKQHLTVCLHILFPVVCLSDGLFALRRSIILLCPLVIPCSVHQRIAPDLLQLPGVLLLSDRFAFKRLSPVIVNRRPTSPIWQPVLSYAKNVLCI